jgi:ribonucleoside-diphosphate reductase subunit M2
MSEVVNSSDADLAFFPVDDLNSFWEEQCGAMWGKGDLDLRQERNDWNAIKDQGIKNLIKGILKFFVFADGMVIENIFKNFQEDTSMYKGAVAFYAAQNFMETIHSEMYSILAKEILSNSEYQEVLDAYKSSDVVKKISAFMKKYMDRNRSLAQRIVAFACVEGVLFTSAFAAIHWVKKKNILRGFCKANEFIARDEAIHTRFGIALYQKIGGVDLESEETIHSIIQEAVEVNREFLIDIIPAPMVGMASTSLLEYTKCTADALSVSLGYSKIYKAQNPFDWMVLLSLSNKTNFFEDKVSEYTKNNNGTLDFDLDADF